MLVNVVLGAVIFLVLAVFLKIIIATTSRGNYPRNDDDPFKPGSTAWFRYGTGSDSYKEMYGERRP
jgi:hypothetical protein